MKTLLIVTILISSLFAGGSSIGNLKNPRSERDIKAMASGYYDTRNYTIIDDTLIVDSTYSGLELITMRNETAVDMTIKYTTKTQPDSVKTTILSAYTSSGLWPAVYQILGTAAGSTGGLVTLFFWNLKN